MFLLRKTSFYNANLSGKICNSVALCGDRPKTLMQDFKIMTNLCSSPRKRILVHIVLIIQIHEKMEKEKKRFVVYNDDFYGGSGRTIIGYVNTLAEGQELLVNRWKKRFSLSECTKDIKEILSHTEEELVGRDSLILYGSNCYFHEGIERVKGYMDEDSKISEEITLGEILKRELAEVGDKKWRMEISETKEEFYLQIDGQNKVPVGTKYEHIVGMPTHRVDNYRVRPGIGNRTISEKTFPNVDWKKLSANEIDNILKGFCLDHDMFYSEWDAICSLPEELVLDKSSSGPHSIKPYDEYGYHIEGISAYHGPYGNGQGVFIHIRKN